MGILEIIGWAVFIVLMEIFVWSFIAPWDG